MLRTLPSNIDHWVDVTNQVPTLYLPPPHVNWTKSSWPTSSTTTQVKVDYMARKKTGLARHGFGWTLMDGLMSRPQSNHFPYSPLKSNSLQQSLSLGVLQRSHNHPFPSFNRSLFPRLSQTIIASSYCSVLFSLPDRPWPLASYTQPFGHIR